MKLIIGENIRRLRLAKDLTQEALAEELGVSPQTVSRWEGCSSYPDVELLPEIAGYFDISVDALIGADIVRQQAHLKAGIRMIHEEKDPEKRIQLAEQLCREHPQSPRAWITLFNVLVDESYSEDSSDISNTRYAEIKKTAEKIFTLSRENRIDYDSTVRRLIEIAPPEDVQNLLDRYANAYDLSRGGLLEHRHKEREEWTMYEVWRQNNLLRELRWWMQARFRKQYGNPPETDVWAMTTLLRFLNLLTGYEGDALIDPTPDLWFSDKQMLAEFLANAQALCGQVDEACRTLEEMLDLIENCVSLPLGTTMTYRCPVLDIFRYKVTGHPDPIEKEAVVQLQMIALDSQGECFGEQENAIADLVFTEPGKKTGVNTMEGFELIRKNPKFKEIVERAKRLLK